MYWHITTSVIMHVCMAETPVLCRVTECQEHVLKPGKEAELHLQMLDRGRRSRQCKLIWKKGLNGHLSVFSLEHSQEAGGSSRRHQFPYERLEGHGGLGSQLRGQSHHPQEHCVYRQSRWAQTHYGFTLLQRDVDMLFQGSVFSVVTSENTGVSTRR